MTLRTGLLIFLGLLTLVSAALYVAVSRTGGMGIPGGKVALEQSLKPYVNDASLRFSEPRIAFREGEDTVEMTLRTLAFETQGGEADIALERISAQIDGARLAQGAIRFRSAAIEGTRIIIDVASLSSKDGGPAVTPKQITENIYEAYRGAFSSMGLGRLSKLSMDNITVILVSNRQELAVGTGALTLQPVGTTIQLSSTLTWRASGDNALNGTSSIFIIGGPEAPLDLTLAVNVEDVKLVRDGADYSLGASTFAATYQQRGPGDAVTRLVFNADSFAMDDNAVFAGRRQFDGLAGVLEYSAQSDRASLRINKFPLAEAALSLTADIKDASTSAVVEAFGTLDNLSTNTLKAYWPKDVSKHGRLWVIENIEGGRVPSADIRFTSSLAALMSGDVANDALKMMFSMEDVSAHYRRPMPALIGAYGTAEMSLERVLFSIASGTINGVDASGSTVLLSAFSQPVQLGEIDLRLTGSSTGLAQALDSEPLSYLSVYDVDPNALSGEFAGRALLKLPLLKDVLLDDIVLSARIDGQALALSGVVDGEDLTFARTVIEITQDALSLRGDIALEGAQAALRWNEDFSGTTDTPTQMTVMGQLDPLGVARWMPGLSQTLFGTIFFDAELRGRGANIAAGTIKADLTAATIDVPELGYTKPVGTLADAYAAMSSTADQWRFDALTLTSPDLLMIADGTLARDGSTAVFSASTIEMPSLNGAFNLSKEGPAWLLAGRASRLDVAPLLDMFWAGALTQSVEKPEEDGAEPDVLSVSINLDEVGLLAGKTARNARILGSFKGDRVRQLNVFGQGPAEAPFTLTIEPIESGRRFVLASQSAGELANGLGMFATATGGQLMVQATSFERGDSLVLAGLMEMTDVRLLDTPVLARLLGLGSLTGVADLARDRGLNFETVAVPFELTNGIVRITNASAKGPALGLTANGEFLESLEKADIRGVIVPSYTINSALGRVPVIGDALIGGRDGGLFGINYRIAGAMDEPELSVNPASMLTPGFLRGIFGEQRGRLEDVAQQPLGSQATGQTTFTP